MATIKVFVSHNNKDNEFCMGIVQALRHAGADVWFDEDNMGAGHILATVQREVYQRPIFIVILSKAAFASSWVRRETTWAYELTDSNPTRVILPIVASPIDKDDFSGDDGWLFLGAFRRIEQAPYIPFPLNPAIERMLFVLALTPHGQEATHLQPQFIEEVEDLIARGKGLRVQGMFKESLPFFQRATEVGARSFDAWFNLGYTLGELRKWPEALAAYQQALTIEPNNIFTLYNQGRAFRSLRRYDEALERYDLAIKLAPNFADAWNGKSGAFRDQKHYEQALESCDRALKLRPKFVSALNNRGNILRKLQRYDEALEMFDEMLKLDDRSVSGLNNRGNVLAELGRDDKALDDFNEALRIQPEFATSWFNRANILAKLRRYDEALTANDGFLTLDPRSVDGWLNRGRILWELARYDEALTAYDRALALDPNNTVAQQSRLATLKHLRRA
jgi:tetratricopeptide (TPR) repeat protein